MMPSIQNTKERYAAYGVFACTLTQGVSLAALPSPFGLARTVKASVQMDF